MVVINPLANLFSTIHNNEIKRKKECVVAPASKLLREVLKVLQREGYIGEFEFIDDGYNGKFRIQLLGRINKCGVISPRFNVKHNEWDICMRQFLPAYNVGILIVTTPAGVMTHIEATKRKLGGLLLGYVY